MDEDIGKHPIKICILGPSRTGKTSIRHALDSGMFSMEYEPTLDIKTKSTFNRKVLDGDKDGAMDVVKTIELWDSPGSRKLTTFKLLGELIANCHGVILVIDLTNYSTLVKMEAFWNQVMEVNPTAVTVLVGNKNEEFSAREIDHLEAKELSDKLCCEGYFEVSAKTRSGLEMAMDCLATACMDVQRTLGGSTKRGKVRRPSIFATAAPTSESAGDEINMLMSPKAARHVKAMNVDKIEPQRTDVVQWYIAAGERDAFLHTFREVLRKGVTVLLYPHAGGAPDYAKLSLHKSNKRLCWEGISSSTDIDGLVINDIAEIRPYTELSYTFRQMNVPRRCEGTDHLFTLVSSQKSIAMAADTPENCIFLVKGLKLMVEKAIPSHIKRKRGKEPISEAKLMLLKNGKKRNDKFKDLKTKLLAGVDVVSITKGINQRELFMFLDRSHKRLVFSRRHRRAVTARSSIVDSLFLYFEGPDPGIDIDDISEIRPGYSLDSLDCKPPPHPSQEQLAISVIGSERTVSILMPSTHERDYFVEKLQTWIKVVRPSVSVY